MWNESNKFYSLVKNDQDVLVSGLTDSYHPMQNDQIARIGDHVARNTGIKFEHAFSYDRDKYVTFLAKTNGQFNIGNDVVKSYIMFNNFHTGRDKSSILTTNIYGVFHDTIETNGKTYKLQNTGNHARRDTYWKAFNCVTYNEDHLRGGVDQISSRLKNNFFTNGKGNIKTSAMNTALELAV